MRYSFALSFALALLGGILIFVLEANIIDLPESYLMTFIGKHKKEQALNSIVPRLTFISKFGI
jgi:hypothetical protein